MVMSSSDGIYWLIFYFLPSDNIPDDIHIMIMRRIMKKYIALLLFALIPAVTFSQAEKTSTAPEAGTNIPVLAQYSNRFKVKSVYFNKKIDPSGRGEILEVEFLLENQTDDPMDLYIFAIATFEKKQKTRSSFEEPIPPEERIRSFVPFPGDISNFTYPDTDSEGKVKKDKDGNELVKLVKFPKDPKQGTDQATGKPYRLEEKLFITTEHVSLYRKNYFFFNEVAILIFDNDGKPVFRQLFNIVGKRGR